MDNIHLEELAKKFSDEQSCIAYLEKIRWGEKRICPRCGSEKTYKFSNGKLFKCAACEKQFTVRIGTIFGDSKIPLQKWFLVIFLATNGRGISSIQVHKYTGVTQKSAWMMLQKIQSVINDNRTPVQQNHPANDGKTFAPVQPPKPINAEQLEVFLQKEDSKL